MLAAALHDVGQDARKLERGPALQPATEEGACSATFHLGLRLIGRAAAWDPRHAAELLHAVGSHHDARAAQTAEAAVLYHANQLDAIAATRPVD